MSHSITLERGGRCSLPSVIVFVNCEPSISHVGTKPTYQVHSFGFGYATCCWLKDGKLDSKAVLPFATAWTFWKLIDEVRDTRKATWVFGHNIGYHLRLLGIWDWIEASGATVVSCVLEDLPTIITVRLGRRLIKFVDVMNYWRLSVRDLAEANGNQLAASNQRPGRQSLDPWPAERNVQVIEKCMMRMISMLWETGCCSLRTTAASLSWATYVKCFLPSKLTITSNPCARRLERHAYFGGRVNSFACGSVKQTVHALDNNSLYPSVMADNHYPCRLVSHPCGLRPSELRAALRYYDGISRVALYPGKYPYPMRTSCGVDFVPGCPISTLAGNELREAAERGDIREVQDCYLYERADLFSSFVKHYYSLKQRAAAAGNRQDVMLYKLMLNSLHGKFGQGGRKWTDSPKTIAQGYYAYWWHTDRTRPVAVRARSVAGQVSLRESGPEPRHAFPAIAACITSNARCILESDILLAGEQNVLYCDTDSIHTLAAGRERLDRVGRIAADRLGHYRDVISAPDAHYFGRQHYRIGDHLVCSSLKPTAVEVADGIYLQDAMMGIERSLETGVHNQVVVSQRIVDMSGRSRDARRTFVTA